MLICSLRVTGVGGMVKNNRLKLVLFDCERCCWVYLFFAILALFFILSRKFALVACCDFFIATSCACRSHTTSKARSNLM